ncbi:MAG: hypothetical protein CMI26_08705 [Opitutae bacterium]|nr:hypothetical protein [Opitutae bacterium]
MFESSSLGFRMPIDRQVISFKRYLLPPVSFSSGFALSCSITSASASQTITSWIFTGSLDFTR